MKVDIEDHNKQIPCIGFDKTSKDYIYVHVSMYTNDVLSKRFFHNTYVSTLYSIITTWQISLIIWVYFQLTYIWLISNWGLELSVNKFLQQYSKTTRKDYL